LKCGKHANGSEKVRSSVDGRRFLWGEQSEIRYMPAIIRLLGCNPLPTAKTLAEPLVKHTTTVALSRKQLAIRLGVDLGILVRWEREDRQPTGVFVGRVPRFLAASKATSSPTAVLISRMCATSHGSLADDCQGPPQLTQPCGSDPRTPARSAVSIRQCGQDSWEITGLGAIHRATDARNQRG
jgi:hypothetical protein